ncbi:MAG: hypothetical protein IH795_10285, partial [Bacteroidetes bacterium]|nr:hypothetical protein [Bacteroidota bacterium]
GLFWQASHSHPGVTVFRTTLHGGASVIPVNQTKFGGSDAPIEEQGDCFRACLASILELALDEVFDDKSQGLGKYAKEDLKNALAAQFSPLMGSVLTSKNPLLTTRGIICDGVIGQAKFGVLVTEEEILGTRNSALKGLPIVSGKIKDHFKEIAEKDDEIKNLKDNKFINYEQK